MNEISCKVMFWILRRDNDCANITSGISCACVLLECEIHLLRISSLMQLRLVNSNKIKFDI